MAALQISDAAIRFAGHPQADPLKMRTLSYSKVGISVIHSKNHHLVVALMSLQTTTTASKPNVSPYMALGFRLLSPDAPTSLPIQLCKKLGNKRLGVPWR